MKQIYLVLVLMMVALQFTKAADGNLQVINISGDTSMNLVTVSLEDSVIIDSLAFNEASAYLTVPEGTSQTLKFTSINYPTEQFELNNLTIDAGEFYQSILNGIIDPTDYFPNPEGISLDLMATWKNVDTSNVDSDRLRVDFFHGVSDAIELDVADLILEYIVDDMSYGEYSATATDFVKDERKLFITSTDSANTIASRMIDLSGIDGKTLTIFLSGFIVPSSNNNGPTINYFAADEAGNIYELQSILTNVFEELVEDFKNYPNPASTFSYLEFNNSILSEISVSLIDLSGRTLTEEQYSLNNGFNKLKINFPNLPNGLYFISINANGSQSALPLVISN